MNIEEKNIHQKNGYCLKDFKIPIKNEIDVDNFLKKKQSKKSRKNKINIKLYLEKNLKNIVIC